MVSVSGQGSIKVWAGFKDGFGRVLIRICSGRVLVGVHGGGSRGSSLLLSRVREEIGPRLAKLTLHLHDDGGGGSLYLDYEFHVMI